MTRDEAIKLLVNATYSDEWQGNEQLTKANLMAIEALQAEAVEIVRCKECQHANECHKSVQYTHNEPNTVTIGYSPIEWCSRGERREP